MKHVIVLVALMAFSAVSCMKKIDASKEAVAPTPSPETAVVVDTLPEPVAATAEVKASPSPTPSVKRVEKAVRLAQATPKMAPVSTISGGSAAEMSVSSTPSVEKRGLHGEAMLGQLIGTGSEARPFTEIVGGLGYRFNDTHNVGFRQDMKKLYELNPSGEEELLFEDTVLYYQCHLSKDFGGIDWTLHSGVTMPVSKASSDNFHATRPSLGLEAKASFLGGKVTVSMQPMVMYYVNQFATSPSGSPLRKMSFVPQAQVAVDVTSRLKWVTWAKAGYHMYEEFDNSSTTPAPTDSLEYGSYAGIQISKNIGTQVGYLKANSMLSDPQVDVNFYDSVSDRFYAAVVFNF